MKYWIDYEGHEYNIIGKRNKYQDTIYTFDIETTSYIIYKGQVLNALEYDKLNENQKQECMTQATMYIWMLGINDEVYYGRTWDDLRLFFERIIWYTDDNKKYIFVHNLSHEFQYLRNEFEFDNVFSRKSRKVMKATLLDYNIEFRCTLYMTNCKLEKLPSIYNLPVQKLTGNLDYNKLRHSNTELTEKELAYCENDCLVVYEYIKLELKRYKTLKNLPMTSTGHVRKELVELLRKDYEYRNKVRKGINIEGHIYNLLVERICTDGYTHANWLYTR